jgi:hypothetical protein
MNAGATLSNGTAVKENGGRTVWIYIFEPLTFVWDPLSIDIFCPETGCTD